MQLLRTTIGNYTEGRIHVGTRRDISLLVLYVRRETTPDTFIPCRHNVCIVQLAKGRGCIYAHRSKLYGQVKKQESRTVARKPRDAAAVLLDLKFSDNIHR